MRENTKTKGSVSVTAKEKCISQEEPTHTAAPPSPMLFIWEMALYYNCISFPLSCNFLKAGFYVLFLTPGLSHHGFREKVQYMEIGKGGFQPLQGREPELWAQCLAFNVAS